MLTGTQFQKLQDLRREQKQELEEIIAQAERPGKTEPGLVASLFVCVTKGAMASSPVP